jgi:phosphatidylglycerophosphate synthase
VEREEHELRWRQVHSLDGAAGGPLVGAWLSVVRRLAGPLARAGAPPALLTASGLALAGVAAAVAMAGGRWALLAALLVASSALADGLDGAVALMSGRATPWGAVLDAGADRLSEVAFALVLWALGAPAWVAAVAVGTAWWQEYLRERAAAAGAASDVVLTVAERPARVAVVAMFTLAAGVFPQAGSEWAATGAAVWALLGLAGVAQLVVAWWRLPS